MIPSFMASHTGGRKQHCADAREKLAHSLCPEEFVSSTEFILFCVPKYNRLGMFCSFAC